MWIQTYIRVLYVYVRVYVIFRDKKKRDAGMETGIIRTSTRRTNMYCKLVGFSVPVSRSLLVSL